MFVATLVINLINFILGVIELFIGMRIILKLAAANAETPFVAWIYETSRALIWPFQGMFPSPVLTGGSVLEFNALIALLAYALIGYLLMEFVRYIEFSTARYTTDRRGRKTREVVVEE